VSSSKVFGAIALVAVGVVAGRSCMAQEVQTKTVVIQEKLPPKTITKTETKVVTETKHVPVFPHSCVEAMKLYTDFHKDMTEYEKHIGKFEYIQGEALKAIAEKDIDSMNDTSEGLADLKADTSDSIQALMQNKKVIDQNISQCKKALDE
jgi:hypothetical protein